MAQPTVTATQPDDFSQCHKFAQAHDGNSIDGENAKAYFYARTEERNVKLVGLHVRGRKSS